MSRSFKKNPFIGSKVSPTSKRMANKKVRRTKDIPNGKAFRKVYETWDIRDYRCYCPVSDHDGDYKAWLGIIRK